MEQFEVYKRVDGKWAWRLTAQSGDVLATDGGQGYENRADAVRVGQAVVSGSFYVDWSQEAE